MPDALSGPELDAEIARRVFGREAEVFDGHAYEPFRDGDGSKDLRLVRPYSTDIAAAWEVLQQVRSWERYPKTCFMEALSDAIRARLGRRDQALILDTQSILMNVEPEDICRAALAALEGSE